jgi:hypothetical protein
MCFAAFALTAVVLAVWLFIPRPAPSPARPKLAAIPVFEKLHWGMTLSDVRRIYPQTDVSYLEMSFYHGYAIYWLKPYPWQGCLADASLLFGPDQQTGRVVDVDPRLPLGEDAPKAGRPKPRRWEGRLIQVWLDDYSHGSRSCKVMALAQIERHFGEGIDQNRLAPTARIADCRPLTPQDRTWPAHMGGIWRCWKKDGTLVRVFDGDPQPLILSEVGAQETPFARPSVDPLWGY